LQAFAKNEARKTEMAMKDKNREKLLSRWCSELRGHWNNRGAATEEKDKQR